MKQQMIQSNPKIMMGKPVVSGTRITVELILEKLAKRYYEIKIIPDLPIQKILLTIIYILKNLGLLHWSGSMATNNHIQC